MLAQATVGRLIVGALWRALISRGVSACSLMSLGNAPRTVYHSLRRVVAISSVASVTRSSLGAVSWLRWGGLGRRLMPLAQSAPEFRWSLDLM